MRSGAVATRPARPSQETSACLRIMAARARGAIRRVGGGSGGSGSGGGGAATGRRRSMGRRRRPGGAVADARAVPAAGGRPLPDLDQLIARLPGLCPRACLAGGPRRTRHRRAWADVPGARGVIALWLASGFYRVQPDEQGVVLRFGAYHAPHLPGLNCHLPWPIETVETPGRHPDQPHRDRLPLRQRTRAGGSAGARRAGKRA